MTCRRTCRRFAPWPLAWSAAEVVPHALSGQDSEIDIATGDPEFSQWRWVTTDRLIELIVPFKRRLYLRVLQEFADLAQ